MKKILLLVFTMIVVLSGCSNDDEGSKFNYDLNLLYGTWEVTHIAGLPISMVTSKTTTATFNTDGTYSGKGYFGVGTGTYKAEGNVISCYIDGDLYAMYEVLDLDGITCELSMSMGGEDKINIKCKKR